MLTLGFEMLKMTEYVAREGREYTVNSAHTSLQKTGVRHPALP